MREVRTRVWTGSQGWRPRSTAAFALALLTAVLMLAFNELGYRQSASRLTELVALGQTRLQLTRLQRRVADAESGQRGYLLTHRPDYLAPYRDAKADALDSLAQLRALRQAQPEALSPQDLQALAGHMQAKLSEMDEVLTLFDGGRAAAAQDLMLTGIGRDEMTSIRLIGERMLTRQNALVAAGLDEVFRTLSVNRVGLSALMALSLGVLGLYLRQRRQVDRERAERQALVQDERDRLELQVQHRTAELTALARHLETAREDERARLARDLHDELGALLTAAKLDVARLRPGLQLAAPELLPRVAHLVDALNSGIALKRRIIEDLRPSSLSNLGLLPALEILCSEFSARLSVPVHTRLDPVDLAPDSELTTFRLVQEALNNIAKHACCAEVTVSLGARAGQAWVQVSDDGVGFDPDRTGLARHGLVGMRYRVQAEGGRLLVQSAPGQGTQIQAWLPQRPPAVDSQSAEVASPIATPPNA